MPFFRPHFPLPKQGRGDKEGMGEVTHHKATNNINIWFYLPFLVLNHLDVNALFFISKKIIQAYIRFVSFSRAVFARSIADSF